MKKELFRITVGIACTALVAALAPVGIKPAHASPGFAHYSSPPDTKGKRRGTTQAQREDAAKRAAARRAAAAQKAEGGSQ